METKIAKLNASVGADEALDRMVLKINDGFMGGKLTKHELVSWIVLFFEESFLEKYCEKIRKDHFDRLSYLDAIVQEVKSAKRKGGSIPDLDALLAPILNERKGIVRLKTTSPDQAQETKLKTAG